jgi:hypothetical protein
VLCASAGAYQSRHEAVIPVTRVQWAVGSGVGAVLDVGYVLPPGVTPLHPPFEGPVPVRPSYTGAPTATWRLAPICALVFNI